MTTPFSRTPIAVAVGGLVMMLGASPASATGFQLNENSGSGLGNAFAGGAAYTDDVTAMWWNPAALSSFPRIQAAGVGYVITPSIKFRNDASQPALNQPLGGDGGDAGGFNLVPNMYVSVPINQQLTFGLGVNAPFGLTTEYDDGWIGRYQALKSQIKTINVNPALSWKATPQFAVGVGVNYQYLDATLNNNVNYSAGLAQAAGVAAAAGQIPAALVPSIIGATSGLNSRSEITGDDGAWGWNVGFAWDVSPQVRLAAAYRSEVKFDVSGNIDFNNPTASPPAGTPASVVGAIALLSSGLDSTRLYNRSLTSDITLPQIANLSMHWQLNPKWEVMADAQWTGWSSITELRFTPVDGSTLPVVPLEWDDTWKLSVGTSYRYNSQWKARAGVAFDQTPVTSHPTPRLPDADRIWLAIGGEYRPTANWKFDAGFVYIFADSPSFNQNLGSTAANALINGSYDVSTTIVSLQATYTFDAPPQSYVAPKVAQAPAPAPAPVVAPPPPRPPPRPPRQPRPRPRRCRRSRSTRKCCSTSTRRC